MVCNSIKFFGLKRPRIVTYFLYATIKIFFEESIFMILCKIKKIMRKMRRTFFNMCGSIKRFFPFLKKFLKFKK